MTNAPRTIAYCLLGLIILASAVLMFSVSYQEPPVGDELVHATAGYSYVKYLDYRLNPEHPPLVKLLSGIPLLFMDLDFPDDGEAWQKGVNAQYAVASEFFYASGNDADNMIRWARVGPIALTLLLTLFIYWWSKKRVGPWWALLPSFLFALSPTILAQGHYVTTDIGAALGISIALYYFIRAWKEPSMENLIWTGLAFGIAQLLKFSAVLLIPCFVILAGIFAAQGFWKQVRNLVIVFAIGFITVYAVYSITILHYPASKQKTDTEAIFADFAGGKTVEGHSCNPARCLADLDIWAADKPVLRPYAHYALGVAMTLRRAHGGGPTYFLGEVSRAGRWYYFPLVYVMKEPLSTLLLIALGCVFSLTYIARSRKNEPVTFLKNHPEEFALIIFILIYVASSMKSPLNIGIRHLIPILPLLYILTTSGLKKWVESDPLKKEIKIGVIVLVLVWFTADVAQTYPYYLSYFNQAIGTENGWKYVTDSNYDWGQDLKRLEAFVTANHIDKIAVDFVGAGDPKYYLGGKAEPWNSGKNSPLKAGIHWVAISIDTLQSAKATLHPSEIRNPKAEYTWLEKPFEPYARVGTSIFIYKI